MSSNGFDLSSDVMVQYRVDHNQTSAALSNKDADGHPEVNDILDAEISQAIERVKSRASKITGVSDIDVDYYGFHGEATE